MTATPMAKRNQTTVTGAASATAILVAMREAPQSATAKSAARIAQVRDGSSLDNGINVTS